MICEECCQYMNQEVRCRCEGGEISSRHIGMVEGCVMFTDGVRCKDECYINNVCLVHHEHGVKKDNGFIDKILNGKK